MATTIDGFEDGDIAEYSGNTSAYSVTTSQPFEGDYSLEITTSSAGSRTIHRTDVSWGPSDGTTLQGWTDRYHHSVSILFGVQGSGDYYYAQLSNEGTSDSEVTIAKNTSSGSFTSLNSTTLGIDRTQYEWLRLVIDWQDNGDITVTVYDQNANSLGSVSANDTTFGSGGIGFDTYDSDSTSYTSYYDSIETVPINASDIDHRQSLDGEFVIRTQITGLTTMNEGQNISVQKGDTEYVDVTVTDGSGTPIDLTGSTINYQAGSNGTVTKSKGNGITVTDAVNGEFEIKFPSSETSDLDPGSLKHECVVEDSDGDTSTIFDGNLMTTDVLS